MPTTRRTSRYCVLQWIRNMYVGPLVQTPSSTVATRIFFLERGPEAVFQLNNTTQPFLNPGSSVTSAHNTGQRTHASTSYFGCIIRLASSPSVVMSKSPEVLISSRTNGNPGAHHYLAVVNARIIPSARLLGPCGSPTQLAFPACGTNKKNPTMLLFSVARFSTL